MNMRKKIIAFIVLMCILHICYGEDNDISTKRSGREQNEKQRAHKHYIHQRHFNDDDWIDSLIWNLIGYSTVLVPAFAILRMAKYSNFNGREGRGFLFKVIQVCVFGSGLDEKSDITCQEVQETEKVQSVTKTTVSLLFCIVGLQGAYLTWGILQERVMTQSYGGDKNSEQFKESEFLVFMNRLSAMLLSGIWILLRRQGRHGAPFYKFSYSSLSNILSSWCQYEALKYVSFPTQVLGKASKLIPVMVMGKFVSKKIYKYHEYLIACMISIGVSLFLLSVASGKHNSAQTTLSGFCLMLGYMLFDSFTSNWQSKLLVEYKLTSVQVMFGTNVFSTLFTGVSLIQNGGMSSSLTFIYQHPEFGYHASAISTASAIGQIFIFYTIATFGPLIFTSIMVTRQMFSILLSCIIFRHYLAPQAVFGIMVVFFALVLQVYAKWRIKRLRTEEGDAKV